MPAAGLLAIGTSVWLNSVSAQPDASLAMAVYPPGWTAERALAAAATAGNIVTLGRVPFSIAVQSAAPALPQRLRTAGAIYVFSPTPDIPCISPGAPDAE